MPQHSKLASPIWRLVPLYHTHASHHALSGRVLLLLLRHREALQQFSARQLRLMFIMNPWNKTVSYGETMRAEMRAREQAIKNFFQNVDVALREAAGREAQTSAKWEVSVCLTPWSACQLK